MTLHKEDVLKHKMPRIGASLFYSVPGAGVEPARACGPQDFKSGVSTNSTIPAITKKAPFEGAFFVERKTGFEPATSTLARSRSTS